MLLFAKVLLFCQYSMPKSKMLHLKGNFYKIFLAIQAQASASARAW